MSQVLAAWDNERACQVALKMLHPELAEDPALVKRFFNEAYALRHLRHPGLVTVFDWGWLGEGIAYLATEFLDESLRSMLNQNSGRLSEKETIDIIAQMTETLTYIHEVGLVHRDIKPANVMFKFTQSEKQTKVLDFGLAKVPENRQGPETPVCTHESMMPGTPEYMAPEQWQCAATVDGRADVYSLGVLFYEMLIGRPPFCAEDAADLMGMHLYEPPPPFDGKTKVAGEVQELVCQMLAKEVGERPLMRDVAQRLQRFPGRK